jgi:hypothetical protein
MPLDFAPNELLTCRAGRLRGDVSLLRAAAVGGVVRVPPGAPLVNVAAQSGVRIRITSTRKPVLHGQAIHRENLA